MAKDKTPKPKAGRKRGSFDPKKQKEAEPVIQWPESGKATYEQAAAFLNCSRRTVERLVAEKKIPNQKVSKRISRIEWADLHSYKLKFDSGDSTAS